jgi:hypothetical protein
MWWWQSHAFGGASSFGGAVPLEFGTAVVEPIAIASPSRHSGGTPESICRQTKSNWIPAFAGMTIQDE